MIKINRFFAVLWTGFLVVGCSGFNSFDLPVTNYTNLTSIECRPWIQQGSNRYSSTCLIDNTDASEKRPLKLTAYTAGGKEVGRVFIGVITIGQKIRVNKTMPLQGDVMPTKLVLEIAEG